MHWENVHHVTTRMVPEPKLHSANISTDQITVLGFVISAITPFIIGIKEVVDSRTKNMKWEMIWEKNKL